MSAEPARPRRAAPTPRKQTAPAGRFRRPGAIFGRRLRWLFKVPPRRRGPLGDGLPRPQRYWAVLTLMTVLVIVVLDSTMVNVALPTIAKSLDIHPSRVVRIVIAYNLTVVVSLLLFSAAAERIGFRFMFGLGLGLFGVASVGSALSTSLAALMLCRVGQGLGSSMLMCLFGGLTRNIYPLRKLGTGISLNATMVGLTAVLGPTIGAWILALASWPWIFLINVPICILASLGIRFLPDVPRVGTNFDWRAALLTVPAFGLAILGLDALGRSPRTAVLYLGVSALTGYILLRRSWHQRAPLVPVDLLRITAIGYAVGASLTLFAAQMSSFVTLPFYFERVLNYSYAEIGVVLGAWSVGTALMAPAAGYFSGRYPIAMLCAIGAGCVALSMLLLLLMPASVPFAVIVAIMFVGGVGFGFFQTPNNRALLAGPPRARSGAAGALQATTRVFGQSMGTAFVALAFGLGGHHGPLLGIAVALCCALVAVGINIARLRNPAGDPELL